MTTILRVEDLKQEYPGVLALKGVDLSLDAGQVLGLVGENGAGKSTLIRIVGGVERPSAGIVEVEGKPQEFHGSAQSQAAGIAVVSQEFRLVPELSIAENIYLGHELVTRKILKRAEMTRGAKKLLETLGLDLDPNRSVSSLTVGDRQLVEIARALSREFHTLIMDEPTAALNEGEIEKLHAIVKALAEQGKGIIYVSHHLDEVFAICDTVAVLRDGNLVAEVATTEIDEPTLVEHMLGRKPEVFESNSTVTEGAQARLELKDFEVSGVRAPVSFEVAPGEVLGLAGLVGSGRSEITRALFGATRSFGGQVLVDGTPARVGTPQQAMKQGIFMLSEDRKGEGILAHLDVVENALASKSKADSSWLRRLLPIRKEEQKEFAELREDMRIRVSDPAQLIGNLSGGNQQKVLLGRALLSGCRVLVLNEPTRGVDVGAKVEIYHLIKNVAAQGVAVVVSSSDAPELEALADRCLVYFAGKQVAELTNSDVNQDNIVHAAVGQSQDGNHE